MDYASSLHLTMPIPLILDARPGLVEYANSALKVGLSTQITFVQLFLTFVKHQKALPAQVATMATLLLMAHASLIL